MTVDEWASKDVHTPGGGECPPCAGLASNALPEAQSTVSAASSPIGVSTRSAHTIPQNLIGGVILRHPRGKSPTGMSSAAPTAERSRHTTT